MKILKNLMFISLATLFSQLNIISADAGILDIKKNNIGLAVKDACYIVPENSSTGETIINIECNSGKRFENVCSQEQPTTGAPPPWMSRNGYSFRKGYVGQIKESNNKRTAYYVCNVQASAD